MRSPIKGEREREVARKGPACIFPMRYRGRMDGRIYIRVITAIRHTERAYIKRVYVYRFIDESLFFFLYFASPSDGTFLVGEERGEREQKSRMVN